MLNYGGAELFEYLSYYVALPLLDLLPHGDQFSQCVANRNLTGNKELHFFRAVSHLCPGILRQEYRNTDICLVPMQKYIDIDPI